VRVWVIRRRALVWMLAGLLTLALVTLAAFSPAVRGALMRIRATIPDACGLPGLPDPAAFSSPAALPWSPAPPELARLQAEHNATILVGAYQIRMREALFEERVNVQRGAELLRGTVLHPGERFSFNQRVGPFTYERGFRDGPEYRGGQVVAAPGGGICKVSSALFNAAVLAGLTVEERHPHTMLVAYVPPGQDAALAYPHKDLRLRNNHDGPVVIWAEYQESTLTVALYGSYEPPLVEWGHEVLERLPHSRIRIPRPELPRGKEQVVIPGLDGVRIRSWLTATYPDGRRQERDLGVTLYLPRPEVVEYGP